MTRSAVSPLFDAATIATFQESFTAHFTTEAVDATLGIEGQAAMSRGDLAGVERLVRGASPTDTLIRLFLLGQSVAASDVSAAIGVSPSRAVESGLLHIDEDTATARLDLRPYREADGPGWWILSDFGADVRPGVLDDEHVLGPGMAATTLAQATMRQPAGRALDVGTGCGIQALHLSRHCSSIVATDLSPRAMRIAATTAALNGLEWDLREGSLLEPVRGERFDLVVCNPPFVVGPGYAPGAAGFRYRDSGFSGDGVCRMLVRGLASVLAPDGRAQLLANWTITGDQPWQNRLEGWLAGSGCDAWVWQREIADPGEYVTLWLRDSGETPGTASWRRRYDHWLDWFSSSDVIAVGMGLVSVVRTDADRPTVVCEDVPQAIEQPVGVHIASWFERSSWLRAAGPSGLLAACLTPAPDLVLAESSVLDDGARWQPALTQLRQTHGLRWEFEVDQAIAGFVAACNGTIPGKVLVRLLADSLGASEESVTTALLPVLQDLVQRGFLVPTELA